MVRQRCVNPFFHRIDYPKSYYFNVILGSIFLAPIRFLLMLLLFWIGSTLARFYIYLLSHIDRNDEPERYHWWRLIFKHQVMFIFRTICFVCGFFSVSVEQRGDPSKEKDAPIIVFAPHTSLFDVLAGMLFDAPSSVAKADIVEIPFFGNIFKLTDPIYVERDSKNSRQTTLKRIEETAKYSKIAFFPEGTCSNHRGLLQFKNGAFRFGYPVLPVALHFEQYGSPDTLSWTWDGPNSMVLLWFTLARWSTHLKLVKLPVYYPSEQEKLDPDLYALNVAKIMSRELTIPCLHYSFDDAKYLRYNVFRSSTCIKFLKLVDKVRPHLSQSSNKKKDSTPAPSSAADQPTSTKKEKTETLFSQFLNDYLDDVRNNLTKHDLSTPITQDVLIEVLGAHSVPDIKKSFSLNDFLFCMQKAEQKPTLLHLSLILQLTDIGVDDLWQRLHNVYNKITKNDDIKLSQFDLKTLLWYALNLEDIDKDEEVCDMLILSFADLKSAIINYYGFALRENAPPLYKDGRK